MRLYLAILTSFVSLLPTLPLHAQERVPGDTWLQYVNPSDAGFDPELLSAAHKNWQAVDSAAFLVIADGAVVLSWGDTERRYMCHSVRKSFLSALYGIYWDRGQLELNKTLADLGVDDEPSPLFTLQQRARILDLLKARSGVFHPAAYAGRTDSRPRGSEGPGRYFAYNNWDFNTLAAILEMETGASVFEAFEEHFGEPLGMQDWRVSDGYFHYQRDLSKYPAYPFRMSARDAARFGLLFARRGKWGDTQILSKHWVDRSSALYSIDSEIMGYGFMWWIFRQPRFADHGMFAALGVGNQLIAALPESDLVIVNRANTYAGERTAMNPLLDLIESVLAARTGTRTEEPRLVSLLPNQVDRGVTSVDAASLQEFVGKFPFPAPLLGDSPHTELTISIEDGHLLSHSPTSGTFALYLQPDGSFHEEDTQEDLVPGRDAQGKFIGFMRLRLHAERIIEAAARGEMDRAVELLERAPGRDALAMRVTAAVIEFLESDPDQAEASLRSLTGKRSEVESMLDDISRSFIAADDLFLAQTFMELNTRLNPNSASSWQSLAEVLRKSGDLQGAERCRERVRAIRAGG